MNILYDLTVTQPVGKIKYHGGGEYAKTVFKALCDYRTDIKIYCIYFEKFELDNWINSYLQQKKISLFPIKSYEEIDAICEKENINVFYSALPIVFSKRPVADSVQMRGTIHGLRYVECPVDRYAVKYYTGLKKVFIYLRNILKPIVYTKHKHKLKKMLEMLDECICVSEHTKYAIKVNFPDYKGKIKVFYTPQKENSYYDDKFEYKGKKYLLLISADRWLKNSYRAIMAIDELFKMNLLENCNVKIVGKIPEQSLRCIKNKDRFEFFDYIPTKDLESLYANCELFIYPSLNEGFGMPPIEAMKYGVTCVVSAICSLTEIYGDIVYYFNPKDMSEIKTRILYAYEHRIDKEKVKLKESQIKIRQEQDLMKICEFIIHEE